MKGALPLVPQQLGLSRAEIVGLPWAELDRGWSKTHKDKAISFPGTMRCVIPGPSECGGIWLLKNLNINRLYLISYTYLVLKVINIKISKI